MFVISISVQNRNRPKILNNPPRNIENVRVQCYLDLGHYNVLHNYVETPAYNNTILESYILHGKTKYIMLHVNKQHIEFFDKITLDNCILNNLISVLEHNLLRYPVIHLIFR